MTWSSRSLSLTASFSCVLSSSLTWLRYIRPRMTDFMDLTCKFTFLLRSLRESSSFKRKAMFFSLSKTGTFFLESLITSEFPWSSWAWACLQKRQKFIRNVRILDSQTGNKKWIIHILTCNYQIHKGCGLPASRILLWLIYFEILVKSYSWPLR